MTVYTLVAGVPAITLVPGMVLKLEAINPATGAAVGGVTASSWTIYGRDVSDALVDETGAVAGPFMLTPGPNSV